MRAGLISGRKKMRSLWAAAVISAVIIFSLCSVSYADGEEDNSYCLSSIFLSTHGSVFSLSLPTKLAFCPKDEGGAYCADDISIVSYSLGGADIKSIDITPPFGWNISSSQSLSSSDKERYASFRFQDTAIPENGTAEIVNMNHIEGKSETPFFYSVSTSDPSSELYSILCADTVITVGWNIIY